MNEGANEQLNEQLNELTVEQVTGDKLPEKKSSPLSAFIDYIELFVVAICVVILLFSVAFRTCTVDGGSMNNTLLDEEVLLVSDMFYTPSREDVIVFHNNDGTLNGQNNKPLVKRVIGIGGDTVTIDHNTQTVTVTDKNGETIVMEGEYVYLDPQRGNPFWGVQEYVVPEGKLFVMGDNRRNSLDSRYGTIGFVEERSVLGKVYFRVAPLSKFGTVN